MTNFSIPMPGELFGAFLEATMQAAASSSNSSQPCSSFEKDIRALSRLSFDRFHQDADADHETVHPDRLRSLSAEEVRELPLSRIRSWTYLHKLSVFGLLTAEQRHAALQTSSLHDALQLLLRLPQDARGTAFSALFPEQRTYIYRQVKLEDILSCVPYIPATEFPSFVGLCNERDISKVLSLCTFDQASALLSEASTDRSDLYSTAQYLPTELLVELFKRGHERQVCDAWRESGLSKEQSQALVPIIKSLDCLLQVSAWHNASAMGKALTAHQRSVLSEWFQQSIATSAEKALHAFEHYPILAALFAERYEKEICEQFQHRRLGIFDQVFATATSVAFAKACLTARQTTSSPERAQQASRQRVRERLDAGRSVNGLRPSQLFHALSSPDARDLRNQLLPLLSEFTGNQDWILASSLRETNELHPFIESLVLLDPERRASIIAMLPTSLQEAFDNLATARVERVHDDYKALADTQSELSAALRRAKERVDAHDADKAESDDLNDIRDQLSKIHAGLLRFRKAIRRLHISLALVDVADGGASSSSSESYSIEGFASKARAMTQEQLELSNELTRKEHIAGRGHGQKRQRVEEWTASSWHRVVVEWTEDDQRLFDQTKQLLASIGVTADDLQDAEIGWEDILSLEIGDKGDLEQRGAGTKDLFLAYVKRELQVREQFAQHLNEHNVREEDLKQAGVNLHELRAYFEGTEKPGDPMNKSLQKLLNKLRS